jgi:hypothetical protein
MVDQQRVDDSAPAQLLEAVSIFLWPLRCDKAAVRRLEERWQECTAGAERLSEEEIRLFHDPGWGKETVEFGESLKIHVTVCPRAAWVPGAEWVVLVLEARLDPNGSGVSRLGLDGLLTFHVGFRRVQGNPEPQDSFFDMNVSDLMLSDGTPAADVYQRYAGVILDGAPFRPLEHLKKAVLLSYARFDRLLEDQELYRLGSVAYPREPITEEWSARLADQLFDRWKAAGWRCFVYSYSLVYALDGSYPGRQDGRILQRLLSDYVKMGVAIAMERAWLQEFPRRLREAQDLKLLRLCHQELVWMQSRFGVRWTPEGTQRMKIEELWRRTSGVDDRLAEVAQVLEQKVEVLEAVTAERLNAALLALQGLLGFLAGAQVGVALYSTWLGIAVGGIVGLLLCGLAWRAAKIWKGVVQ